MALLFDSSSFTPEKQKDLFQMPICREDFIWLITENIGIKDRNDSFNQLYFGTINQEGERRKMFTTCSKNLLVWDDT